MQKIKVSFKLDGVYHETILLTSLSQKSHIENAVKVELSDIYRFSKVTDIKVHE